MNVRPRIFVFAIASLLILLLVWRATHLLNNTSVSSAPTPTDSQIIENTSSAPVLDSSPIQLDREALFGSKI